LREALNLLEVERVITTKHGSGRYLISFPDEFGIDITRLQGVTELLESYDIQASDKLIEVEKLKAFGEICDQLGVEEGTDLLAIKRLRFAKNTPIIYSIDILPRKILPEIWREEDFKGSLYTYLEEQCHIQLDHAQATIRATLLRGEVNELVPDPLTPWILLEQLIYDRDGRPIIFSKDYHQGDHIVFHVRRYRRQ
jgi:GntR family transcriptional regulator